MKFINPPYPQHFLAPWCREGGPLITYRAGYFEVQHTTLFNSKAHHGWRDSNRGKGQRAPIDFQATHTYNFQHSHPSCINHNSCLTENAHRSPTEPLSQVPRPLRKISHKTAEVAGEEEAEKKNCVYMPPPLAATKNHRQFSHCI